MFGPLGPCCRTFLNKPRVSPVRNIHGIALAGHDTPYLFYFME
jgi:hypothetical protein